MHLSSVEATAAISWLVKIRTLNLSVLGFYQALYEPSAQKNQKSENTIKQKTGNF